MDKYDLAIEFLTKNPLQIPKAWDFPETHIAGCLFQFATTTGGLKENCGCLTTIKYAGLVAETEALTLAIRADRRIPKSHNIKVKNLPIFAEWQRFIDKELNRNCTGD